MIFYYYIGIFAFHCILLKHHLQWLQLLQKFINRILPWEIFSDAFALFLPWVKSLVDICTPFASHPRYSLLLEGLHS